MTENVLENIQGHVDCNNGFQIYQFGETIVVVGLMQHVFMKTDYNMIKEFITTMNESRDFYKKLQTEYNTIESLSGALKQFCKCEFVKVASEYEFKSKIYSMCNDITEYVLTYQKPACSLTELANIAQVTGYVMKNSIKYSDIIDKVSINSRQFVYIIRERTV